MSVYSQEPIQRYFALDSIIPFNKIGDFGPSSEFVKMAMTDSLLLAYLGSNDSTSDGFSFVRVALPSKAVDSFKVSVPNPSFPFESFMAHSMALSSRYCAILFFRSILLLEFKGTKLQFKRWIQLQYPFTYIGIQGNQIVLGGCYNHHPLDAETPTALEKIDIETGNSTGKIHPSFDAIEFTHFSPSHWIDFSSNLTAFAQTLEYKIDIFDKNLNQISTVQRKDGWKGIDTTALHTIRSRQDKANPKQIIEELEKGEKGDGQRIINANFISDSMLIVCSSAYLAKEKKSGTFYYDIWRVNNGKWELYLKDLIDTKPAGETICQSKNFPNRGVYYNSSFTKEWTANIRVAPDSKIMFQIGKSYSKIKTETDDYNAKHDPTFQIYLYKLKLPK